MSVGVEWEALPEGYGAALVCEPRRRLPPFLPPFLSDGRNLYEVVGWRAGQSPSRPVTVRRLAPKEGRRVREALLEAAEETFYRLPRRRR